MSKMEVTRLRVKNVIKTLTVFLLIFNSFIIFSQGKIKGSYYVDYKLKNFSTNYNFFNDSIFEYKHTGHLGLIKYGTGHYYLKKDSLILDYDLTKLQEESYHKSKSYSNSNDSIRIKLNIFNYQGEIDIKGNFQVYSLPNYTRGFSENDYTFYFHEKKGRGSFKVVIEALEYDRHDIYIDINKSYEIDVYMRKIKKNPLPQAIKYIVKNYRIKNSSDSEIVLTNEFVDELVLIKSKKPR